MISSDIDEDGGGVALVECTVLHVVACPAATEAGAAGRGCVLHGVE